MKSNMKLKTRLILLNLGVILLFTGGMIGYLLFNNYETTENAAITNMEQEAKIVSSEMEVIIDKATHDAQAIATTLEYMKRSNATDRAAVNKMLEDILSNNDNYVYTWAAFEPNAFDQLDINLGNTLGSDAQGRYMPSWGKSGNQLILEHCKDVDTKDYYTVPKTTGSLYIAPPATYELDGQEITTVTFAQPIIVDGQFYGVTGLDISLHQFKKLNSEVAFYENGFGRLSNENGLVLAHPNEDRINATGVEFGTQEGLSVLKRLQGGESITSKAWSPTLEQDTYRVYSPINFDGTDLKWTYTIIVPIKEMMADANHLIVILTMISLVGITIMAAIMYLNSNYVVRSIVLLSEIIEKLSNYDLSFDENHGAVKFIDRTDETGDITRALAKMQENFIALLAEVKDTSIVVSTSSEELNATSEEVAMSAEEVSNTIQELAHGATEQATETELGASQVNELGDLMNNNEASLNEVVEMSERVNQHVVEGLEVIEDLIQKTDLSGKSSTEIYEVIQKTNTSSEKIRSASEMIASIADQTNLLALNAAIEAARAGEAGKGFAVVAEEIRKLAEQSTASTKEIDDVVEELTHNSSEAVTKMQEVSKIIIQQVESVHSTQGKYKEISSAFETTDEAITRMKVSSDDMQTKKEKILEIVQSLSAIAEENAASTEQVSASIQEQLAATQEVANASEQLSLVSVQLQENVDKFKL